MFSGKMNNNLTGDAKLTIEMSKVTTNSVKIGDIISAKLYTDWEAMDVLARTAKTIKVRSRKTSITKVGQKGWLFSQSGGYDI